MPNGELTEWGGFLQRINFIQNLFCFVRKSCPVAGKRFGEIRVCLVVLLYALFLFVSFFLFFSFLRMFLRLFVRTTFSIIQLYWSFCNDVVMLCFILKYLLLNFSRDGKNNKEPTNWSRLPGQVIYLLSCYKCCHSGPGGRFLLFCYEVVTFSFVFQFCYF